MDIPTITKNILAIIIGILPSQTLYVFKISKFQKNSIAKSFDYIYIIFIYIFIIISDLFIEQIIYFNIIQYKFQKQSNITGLRILYFF